MRFSPKIVSAALLCILVSATAARADVISFTGNLQTDATFLPPGGDLSWTAITHNGRLWSWTLM